MEQTIHGKLVAKRDGMYTVFVFQEDNGNYVMCTKLPNWGPYEIVVGDSGFLTWQSAQSGEKYIDRDTGEEKVFKYTNIYFKDFVKDNENSDEIIL